MKNLLFLISGIFIGTWISWPGIVSLDNWRCVSDIIDKSREDKISMKAVLALSPNYLFKNKSYDNASKLRILSDACFR